MQYTVFDYMYRDAANYKVHGSLWLEGAAPDGAEHDLRALLDADEFFVPEQVGIPALQSRFDEFGGLTPDDHVWHTFVGLRQESSMPPDAALHTNWRQFIGQFEAVAGNWRLEWSNHFSMG